MPFSSVPIESKSQIDKAGKSLVSADNLSDEFAAALDLANRWRACHAYPLNSFQATMRVKLRALGSQSIVAQRLKRMATIVDKLRRYPNMNLSQMQDIGGLRAIVSTVDEVYTLTEQYENSSRMAHELLGKKDYISKPRDEDGYRCIHLVYKYRNKKNDAYDGLRIEVQIRSKLQHSWATAVETVGTILNQSLKSRQGEARWLDFFCLVSSAFAYLEGTARIHRYAHLSKAETFAAVEEAEKELGALEIMNGIAVAANAISTDKGKALAFHLIALNLNNRTVEIRSYDREGLERAVIDLRFYENEAIKDQKIIPVLVSAGPVDKLKKAYPNFFLDIRDFEKHVRTIIHAANS